MRLEGIADYIANILCCRLNFIRRTIYLYSKVGHVMVDWSILSRFRKPGGKRDKKKKITHLTMMVIPNCHGVPVRNFTVPMWAVKSFIAVSVSCMLIVGYFVTGYFYLGYVSKENQQLKEVNVAQAKELQELNGLAGSMKSKLDALIKLDEEVREKVGLTKASNNDKKLVQSSRTQERIEFITMGVNTMMPYAEGTEAALFHPLEGYVNSEESGQEITNAEDILKLPVLEDKVDTLHDLKTQLAQMDEEITRQADVMDKLTKDVDKQTAMLKALPDLWPLRGRITSAFGWRQNPFSKKGREYHEGIDIAASYGTGIRAAGDGVVIYSGWKSSWGRLVIVSHGFGYVTQYAHNSSLLCKKGDKVTKGQIIARLGNTGRSTGPHCHFGIAKNGQWINPLTVLKSS